MVSALSPGMHNEQRVVIRLKVKRIPVVPSYRGLMKVAISRFLNFWVGFQQIFFEYAREHKLLDEDNPFTLVEESVKADDAFLFVDLGDLVEHFSPFLSYDFEGKSTFATSC